MNLKQQIAKFVPVNEYESEIYNIAQQQAALIEIMVTLIRPFIFDDGNRMYNGDQVDGALQKAKEAGYD